AIDIAISQQLPVLNFSFHSPSLQPGNTPYVRSEADLEQFYRWWEVVLDHLSKCGVEPTTAAQIVAMAEQTNPPVVCSRLPMRRGLRYRALTLRGPVAQWLELAAHNG